jgi:hypothetical protein
MLQEPVSTVRVVKPQAVLDPASAFVQAFHALGVEDRARVAAASRTHFVVEGQREAHQVKRLICTSRLVVTSQHQPSGNLVTDPPSFISHPFSSFFPRVARLTFQPLLRRAQVPM